MNNGAHQLMTELFRRAVDDGKRLFPNTNESAAYALSIMSACMGVAMQVIMRKCDDTELRILKNMFEEVVKNGEEMAKADRGNYEEQL